MIALGEIPRARPGARPVLYLRQPRRVATHATAPMIPTRLPLSNGRNTRSETHAAPATMSGIYYWIVIREGSPLLAAPAILIMPFALRRAAPRTVSAVLVTPRFFSARW